MINIISFVALLALSVSLVSAGCDYNVYNVSQLATILTNDQSGWTSVPTLCFAAGTYTFTSNLGVTASQKWVGPQQGVDPTCGRLINPPCARYTSASNYNATLEAVFNIQNDGIHVTSTHVNFTMDGFVVVGDDSTFITETLGMALSFTLNNSYVYQVFIDADYFTFDRSYFGWSDTDEYVIYQAVSTTVTNSFFYQAAVCESGSITAIGNTFVLVETVAEMDAPSYFENNAFYAITNDLVDDGVGKTSFKNNTFWSTYDSVYNPSAKSIIDFDSNCFVDVNVNSDTLNFNYGINTTNAVFTNNYFGSPNGPQIYYYSPSFTVFGSKFGPSIAVSSDETKFDFKYSSKRLHFQPPNVCPHPTFSLTVKPHNIKLGETVNITFTFNGLDPLIVGAGITPSLFDGITLQLYLSVADVKSENSQSLYAFALGNGEATFNPSTQSSLSLTYAIQPEDLSSYTNGVSSPPNYYIYCTVVQNNFLSPLYRLYYNGIYAPITITPKVPLECYNMSLSINKNVTAGPLKYNFQQVGCSSSNWAIISVNTSNLFSYDNSNNLVINTGANLSGVRLAHYQVSLYAGNVNGPSNLAHNVVTKITIVNHNPVINSANFTWIYPRTQQTFPNWNLLTNCTDQDGDNVTVVQIQRNKARTNTSVVQLDDFTLYFVPEKVVVSVLPTGEIKFTAPSNSNPVTAGSPLALFWKQDISFQFQISDGDVIKQYAWGIANIVYV